jgi:hypothetical protein
MTAKSTLLETRFMLNMSRINGLMQLQYANFKPKPTHLFLGEEGPRADIFRAIIVFLHATFEVLLRSHMPTSNRNVNFYSRADLEKALKRSTIDSTPFKPLYPPLVQMAKRRTRIVHDADLSNRSATICDPWKAADEWQLGMWFMATISCAFP